MITRRNLRVFLTTCLAVVFIAACGSGEPPVVTPERAVQVLRIQASAIGHNNTSVVDAATQLMDYAESNFPTLFPGYQINLTASGFIYRYYPATQVYLGIALSSTPYIQGNVYVVGPPFGNTLTNPQDVGPITNYIVVGNVAPLANAGVAKNVVTGSLVTLDGSASLDANGDSLTYAWTLTFRPAGSAAVLSSTTSAKPTLTADAAGTYVATLVVNDSRLNSAAATITVTATSGVAPTWASVSTRGNQTRAIKTDGTLWAWGLNGTFVNQNAPTQIGVATTWASVSTGYEHTLAKMNNGTLWAWGFNGTGQLGDGTTVSKNAPIQIGAARTWASVSAGDSHTLAIKTDGTLWAWGSNNWGQLGDGTTIDKNAPIQIGIAATWASVSAGGISTLAIRTDGTLWAWGSNFSGQLGDGTTIDKNAPIQIGEATTWGSVWASVSADGWGYTVARKADGTFWAWGHNGYGQLGDGTFVNKNVPTQIGAATTWASVSTGGRHTLARKADGTLWAWGSNSWGQLGDGTFANKNVPTQIGVATTWASVSAGFDQTLATKADGTLWAWGHNGSGQLGDGTTRTKNAPVNIP